MSRLTGSAGDGAVAAEPIAVVEAASVSSGQIRIPLARLSGKANFFTHDSGGRSIRFFALKSSDGVFRAALDACDECYAAKKGYFQHGDDMVCKKCNQRFPSALINDVSGGCNPVPLERTMEATAS